jgi:fatty acid desaturase
MASGRPWLAAAGPYFLKLLGGHALISAASSIALAFPQKWIAALIERAAPGENLAAMRTSAIRAFANSDRRSRIRGDLLSEFALLAAALYCWGAHWPVFAASVAARFLVLSVLDNAPHYGTAIDSGTDARNSRLPRWFSWLLTGQNLHGIHHGAPSLRWQELPAAFGKSGRCYDGSWAITVFRQFRGPLVLPVSKSGG